MKPQACYYLVGQSKVIDKTIKPMMAAVVGQPMHWQPVHPDQLAFYSDNLPLHHLQTFLDTYQQEHKGKYHILKTYRLHPLGEQASRLGLKKNPGKVDSLGNFLLQSVLEGNQSLLPFIHDEFAFIPRHLMQTASMLLASDRNATIASERLYVHRNTFAYRLNQFITLTGLDIRQHDHALLFALIEKLLMR